MKKFLVAFLSAILTVGKIASYLLYFIIIAPLGFLLFLSLESLLPEKWQCKLNWHTSNPDMERSLRESVCKYCGDEITREGGCPTWIRRN